MHCPARSLCSPETPQHSFQVPFFLCSSYPLTQWDSLTHSWLVLIFHLLCGVTVGCHFMFSSGGDSSLLFFQDLLFGNFPFHLVTWKWMFVQLAFPFHCCCFYISVEFQREECRGGSRLSPRDSEAHSQHSFQRAEWKGYKSADRDLLKSDAHLWSQKSKVWTVGTLEPKGCKAVIFAASSEWLKQIQPFVQLLGLENTCDDWVFI